MTTVESISHPESQLPALGEIGIRSSRLPNVHNPRIVLYHSCAGRSQTDEIPWCSAFVNWCMRQAQINGTGHPGARSWLQWGQSLPKPVFGSVTVLTRPGAAWYGHVGFYVGMWHDKVCLVGGNQDSRVKIKPYPISQVLGHRWPHGMQLPNERGPTLIPWSS